MSRNGPLAAVADYYDGKVQRFGPTPLGVDWPSMEAIRTRLDALLEIAPGDSPFSINDLGCGWGAALEMLGRRREAVDYIGIDIAPAMIEAARALWAGRFDAQFVVGSGCTRKAHYTIASGIFNVKLGATRCSWERHVRRTLRDMHANSTEGFAVNFLLPTARTQRVTELYATLPDEWVAFCSNALGRRARIVSDYGLAEFTLLLQ